MVVFTWNATVCAQGEGSRLQMLLIPEADCMRVTREIRIDHALATSSVFMNIIPICMSSHSRKAVETENEGKRCNILAFMAVLSRLTDKIDSKET